MASESTYATPSDAVAGLDCALLADGSLTLRADAATAAQVCHWLPHLPAGAPDAAAASSRIDVVFQPSRPEPPEPRPVLALGPIRAWIDAEPGRVALHARDNVVAGTIDLARLTATVGVGPEAAPAEPRRADVFSALTISAALLLNRMGRALLHAAAVAPPDGGAWLLVGDAFAGKTTTTVNLISTGWDYLSDDHVILARAPDGTPIVEGWPRAFHLDRGYEAGISLGEREAVDPAGMAPGRWRRSAPLAGLLFPTVVADQPTRAEPTAAATVLTGLIRQSPWLLADRAVARDVLSLLSAASSLPAFMLRLGRDSYRDPERLLDALATTGM